MRGRLHIACLSLVFLATEAHAGHHRWDFSEAFTNFDGSIQFVELFSANDGEAGLNGFTITSDTGSFSFVGNLPSSMTADTWVLVATSAFTPLTNAPTPDYTLPDDFFDPASDTLIYAGGSDTWVISGVPENGTDSLDRTTGVGPNTPTNFAGDTGTVDAGGPPSVPGPGALSIALLTGLILFAASGIVQRRPTEA